MRPLGRLQRRTARGRCGTSRTSFGARRERQGDATLRPELVELGHDVADLGAPLLVEVLEPLPWRAALGERLARRRAARRRAGRSSWSSSASPGAAVARCMAMRCVSRRPPPKSSRSIGIGGRQHDVGVPGHRRPVRLVDDDRVGHAERACAGGRDPDGGGTGCRRPSTRGGCRDRCRCRRRR